MIDTWTEGQKKRLAKVVNGWWEKTTADYGVVRNSDPKARAKQKFIATAGLGSNQFNQLCSGNARDWACERALNTLSRFGIDFQMDAPDAAGSAEVITNHVVKTAPALPDAPEAGEVITNHVTKAAPALPDASVNIEAKPILPTKRSSKTPAKESNGEALPEVVMPPLSRLKYKNPYKDAKKRNFNIKWKETPKGLKKKLVKASELKDEFDILLRKAAHDKAELKDEFDTLLEKAAPDKAAELKAEFDVLLEKTAPDKAAELKAELDVLLEKVASDKASELKAEFDVLLEKAASDYYNLDRCFSALEVFKLHLDRIISNKFAGEFGAEFSLQYLLRSITTLTEYSSRETHNEKHKELMGEVATLVAEFPTGILTETFEDIQAARVTAAKKARQK